MSSSNTHLVMRKTSQYSHRYPAILDLGIITHEISNTSLWIFHSGWFPHPISRNITLGFASCNIYPIFNGILSLEATPLMTKYCWISGVTVGIVVGDPSKSKHHFINNFILWLSFKILQAEVLMEATYFKILQAEVLLETKYFKILQTEVLLEAKNFKILQAEVLLEAKYFKILQIWLMKRRKMKGAR